MNYHEKTIFSRHRKSETKSYHEFPNRINHRLIIGYFFD